MRTDAHSVIIVCRILLYLVVTENYFGRDSLRHRDDVSVSMFTKENLQSTTRGVRCVMRARTRYVLRVAFAVVAQSPSNQRVR